MEYKDYYKILGVPRDADDKTIRKAFRKLARQFHPDVNPDDPAAEERFKDVTEAYEVLGDPEKRAKYDQFGQAWRSHQGAGGPGGFDWSQWTHQQQGPQPGVQYRYATAEDLEDLFGGAEFSGFSDFFEALFGRAGRRPNARSQGTRQRPRAGRDIRHPVRISLTEAYHGATRMLNKDGRRLEVKIPPGVRTGSKVRVRGEGEPGRSGGKPGDLYLEIEVAPDNRFERRGNDLLTTVDVPLTTAVLGGEVRVPTLSGDVQLKIPPGTQNGRRFRLRGKGMPKLSTPDQHGDLLATVNVKLPTQLSDEQRTLFERLRQLEGG